MSDSARLLEEARERAESVLRSGPVSPLTEAFVQAKNVLALAAELQRLREALERAGLATDLRAALAGSTATRPPSIESQLDEEDLAVLAVDETEGSTAAREDTVR